MIIELLTWEYPVFLLFFPCLLPASFRFLSRYHLDTTPLPRYYHPILSLYLPTTTACFHLSVSTFHLTPSVVLCRGAMRLLPSVLLLRYLKILLCLSIAPNIIFGYLYCWSSSPPPKKKLTPQIQWLAGWDYYFAKFYRFLTRRTDRPLVRL